jgi:hypothetical protein
MGDSLMNLYPSIQGIALAALLAASSWGEASNLTDKIRAKTNAEAHLSNASLPAEKNPSLSIPSSLASFKAVQSAYGVILTDQLTSALDSKDLSVNQPLIALKSNYAPKIQDAGLPLAEGLSAEDKSMQAEALYRLASKSQLATLFYREGNVEPCRDYQLVVSDEGETMILTWSSHCPALHESYAKSVMSTDGGLTWTHKEILNPLLTQGSE